METTVDDRFPYYVNLPEGKRLQKTMGRPTILNGKTRELLKQTAMFNVANC